MDNTVNSDAALLDLLNRIQHVCDERGKVRDPAASHSHSNASSNNVKYLLQLKEKATHQQEEFSIAALAEAVDSLTTLADVPSVHAHAEATDALEAVLVNFNAAFDRYSDKLHASASTVEDLNAARLHTVELESKLRDEVASREKSAKRVHELEETVAALKEHERSEHTNKVLQHSSALAKLKQERDSAVARCDEMSSKLANAVAAAEASVSDTAAEMTKAAEAFRVKAKQDAAAQDAVIKVLRREVEELKTKTKCYKEEAAALKTKCDRSEQEQSDLQEELVSLKASFEETTKLLAASERVVAEHMSTIESNARAQEVKLSRLQETVASHSMQQAVLVKQHEDAVELLKKEHEAELQRQKEVFAPKKGEQETLLQQQQEIISANQAAHEAELKKLHDALAAKTEEHDTAMELLRAGINENRVIHENEVKKLNETIAANKAEYEASLKKHGETRAANEAEIKKYAATIESNNAEYETSLNDALLQQEQLFLGQIKELEEEKARLEAAVAKKDAEFKALKEDAKKPDAAATAQLHRLQQDLDQVTASMEDFQQLLEAKESEVSALHQQIDDIVAENDALTEENDAQFNAILSKLNERNEETAQKNESLQNEVLELTERYVREKSEWETKEESLNSQLANSVISNNVVISCSPVRNPPPSAATPASAVVAVPAAVASSTSSGKDSAIIVGLKGELESIRGELDDARQLIAVHNETISDQAFELDSLKLKLKNQNVVLTSYYNSKKGAPSDRNDYALSAASKQPSPFAAAAPSDDLQQQEIADAARKFSIADGPIVYIEIGGYECRVGIFDANTNKFDVSFICPSLIARARKGVSSPTDLVKSASFKASPMYSTFREHGVFVGKDAAYCCYDHPDASLRGNLEATHAIIGTHVPNLNDYALLLKHCLWHALDLEDMSSVQVLFGYKLRCKDELLGEILDIFFDELHATKVCLLSEANLSFSAMGIAYSLPQRVRSALLIDIGATTTTVYPVYEGMVLRNGMRTMNVGGEHCTDFMEMLLDKHQKHLHAEYSSQLPRRRKNIARQVKEQTSFVVEDFSAAIAKYGGIEYQEAIQVMIGNDSGSDRGEDKHQRKKYFQRMQSAAASSMGGNYDSPVVGGAGSGDFKFKDNAKNIQEIEMTVDVAAGAAVTSVGEYGTMNKTAKSVAVTVACERFYCMERLFDPSIMYSMIKGDSSTTSAGNYDDSSASQPKPRSAIAGVSLVAATRAAGGALRRTSTTAQSGAAGSGGSGSGSDDGLIQLILSSIEAIDDDGVRRDLAENIMLCGRSSVVPGLSGRIEHDLRQNLTALCGMEADDVIVGCLEDPVSSEDSDAAPSSAWRGATLRVSEAVGHETERERGSRSATLASVPLEKSNIITAELYDEMMCGKVIVPLLHA